MPQCHMGSLGPTIRRRRREVQKGERDTIKQLGQMHIRYLFKIPTDNNTKGKTRRLRTVYHATGSRGC